MREADEVQHLLAANTHDSLLFFTDRGRVFQVKVYDLPDAGRTAKGVPIINLIAIQPNESITTMLPIRSYDEGNFLFMCTRKGTVKRTALSQFSSVRSSGLIAITLDEDDELAWVRPTSGDDEIILVTEQAKAIRFHENDVRGMGRQAAGVIGIRLASGDRVMAMNVIGETAREHDLLIVSENGYGKRTAISEFNDQRRGGQGVTAIKLSTRNGRVAGAQIVGPEQEVMFISNGGTVIRTRVSSISRYGRQAQGVGLMRLAAGDRVASMTALSERQEEAEALAETLSENAKVASGAAETPKKNGRTPKAAKS
jgi:DNA gyrase subunit A